MVQQSHGGLGEGGTRIGRGFKWRWPAALPLAQSGRVIGGGQLSGSLPEPPIGSGELYKLRVGSGERENFILSQKSQVGRESAGRSQTSWQPDPGGLLPRVCPKCGLDPPSGQGAPAGGPSVVSACGEKCPVQGLRMAHWR